MPCDSSYFQQSDIISKWCCLTSLSVEELTLLQHLATNLTGRTAGMLFPGRPKGYLRATKLIGAMAKERKHEILFSETQQEALIARNNFMHMWERLPGYAQNLHFNIDLGDHTIRARGEVKSDRTGLSKG